MIKRRNSEMWSILITRVLTALFVVVLVSVSAGSADDGPGVPISQYVPRNGNEALGAFRDPKIGRVQFDDWIHRIYIVNSSAVVEINQRFHGWGGDHYYRDFWMFARRQGRWQLVRYDYEPQSPFLDR